MSQIAAEDKVPFWQKVAYSSAAPMDWFSVGLATSVLWMPVWNIGFGLSPSVLGIILLVYRGWDALVSCELNWLKNGTIPA